MKVIESWDKDANFWEANPQIKVPAVFNKLYKEDKSKGKAQSSLLMWAVAFYADFDSKFRSLSDAERKKIVLEDVLNDLKFDWKKLEPYITGWDLFTTAAQKQMMTWEKYTNTKTEVMEKIMTELTEAEDVSDKLRYMEAMEKLLLTNVKLYKEYSEIMERLTQESSGGEMWGGGKESLSESGDI
jgi:hypothetical protein